MVLGCKGVRKNFLGPESFFEVQPSKTELRARYSTMPGLENSFWHGIRFRKEWVGQKLFQAPNIFFRCRLSKQSKGPDILPWQGLKVHFGVGCTGGGGKESTFRSRKFVFDLGARNKAAQARQAKTSQGPSSLRGQMTYSESGWCLAEAVDVSLGDHVRLQIFLGLHHVCHRHGSSAVHTLSFGK